MGIASRESSAPIPRAQMSVVMSTRFAPERNSCMMASRSFWVISPCIAETVKLESRILSASQSTYFISDMLVVREDYSSCVGFLNRVISRDTDLFAGVAEHCNSQLVLLYTIRHEIREDTPNTRLHIA